MTKEEAMFAEIKDELEIIRKAVLGNGGRGIKDTVAVHGLALKIIGTGVVLLVTGAITALVRLVT